MSNHQLISLITTLVISGFSLSLIFSRIKTISLSYHQLNLGHYDRIKELCGKDAKNNLCELRVALAAFTNKDLLPVEIEWFVYTPGAFKHLKKFGACYKYLDIDLQNNKFIWFEKFQSSGRRIFEQFKMFMYYLVSGTLGLSIILSYDFIYKSLGITPTILIQIFAVLLCIAALVFLWMMNTILDSKKLLKTEII